MGKFIDIPLARDFFGLRFRWSGFLSVVLLLCLGVPQTARAYWVISYETTGSTELVVLDRYHITGVVTEKRREITPWPQTLKYGAVWGSGSDRDPFPTFEFIPKPFGLQFPNYSGHVNGRDYFRDGYHGSIHIEGDITTVLTWKGGGRPPGKVRVTEGAAAVVQAGYYYAGHVPAEISGLQDKITDCGFGTAQINPNPGAWGSVGFAKRVVDNPNRLTVLRLPTRHLKARISCGIGGGVGPSDRHMGGYVEYRAHIPGQGKPNAPGDSPTYPSGCDDFAPEQGGSPCTTNGNAGPSAPDPVDLTNGHESNEPGPDLAVYNPNGPAVVWRRNYRQNHALSGYSSDGFSPGWVHNYDISARFDEDENGYRVFRLRYPGGAEEMLYAETDENGDLTGAVYAETAKYRVTTAFDPVSREFTELIIRWKDGTRWKLGRRTADPDSFVLKTIANRSGRAISFQYTSDGALASISDYTSGTPLLTLVRQSGYVVRLLDAYGRKVVYANHADELVEVSRIGDVSGGTPSSRWEYAYFRPDAESPSLLKTVTVPSPTGTGKQSSHIEYEPDVDAPRVTALVDAYGNRTEFTYHIRYYADDPYTSPIGGYTRVYVKDASGALLSRFVRHYDMENRGIGSDAEDFAGNVVRQSRSKYEDFSFPFSPTRVTINNRVTDYTYDSYGNLVMVQSPGATRRYTYDTAAFPYDRLESVIERNVSGTERVLATFAYTSEGYVASVETPSPGGGTATTAFVYDSLGNVTQVSAPGITPGQSLVTTYDYETDNGVAIQPTRFGQPVAITNPLGHVTHLRYDAQGYLISSVDNAGSMTNYTYNVAGQVVSVTLPATGQTGAGRGTVGNYYLYPGGPVRGTEVWDESGQLTRQTHTDYGAEGEVLAEYGDTPEPVRYYYDGMRRLTGLTNAANHDISYYYYDEDGDMYAELLVNSNQPLGFRQRNFDHDEFGNLIRQTDFFAQDYANTIRRLRFTYAASDFALTGVYKDEDLTDPVATYTYDSWRRVQTRTDLEGTQTYTYGDAANELRSVATQYTGLPTLTLGYTYKHNGARATMTTPAGTFTYGYDATGRPTTLTNQANETTQWAYEPVRGLLQSQTSANGIVAQYVYDALGRTTGLTNRDASNAILSQFTTPATGGFDSVGNRLGVAANIPGAPNLSGITEWAYNSQSRLTGEQSARFGGWNHGHGYDAAGNVTTLRGQSRTYDAQNQLTGGQGLGAFSYDVRGNPTTYNGVSLTWDAQDNPTAFGTLLTAGYTADGLRAWKEDAQGERTYFLYDGTTPVLESYADGATKAANTWGANGLVSRREYDSTGSTQSSVFYGFDERGNASERTDGAGQVLTRSVADAYGNTSSFDATTGAVLAQLPDPYSGYGAQFGYYADTETGLYLCTYRYYDPNNARWLNRDPIGYEGGFNVYAYVTGNPINLVDPLGLAPPYPVGQIITVDPRTLDAGRQYLDVRKVNDSYRRFQKHQTPPPIQINSQGVIVNGNSRARAAGQIGAMLDAEVVNTPMVSKGPIMSAPFYGGRPVWDTPMSRVGRAIGGFFRGLFTGGRSSGSGGGAGLFMTLGTGAGATADGSRACLPYAQTNKRMMDTMNGDPDHFEIPDQVYWKP